MSAATLDTIRQRGNVQCGTAPNIPGFAFTDDMNVQRGFDVDLCRALCAAVLGDADKADYFRARKMEYRILTFADLEETRNAYEQRPGRTTARRSPPAASA